MQDFEKQLFLRNFAALEPPKPLYNAQMRGSFFYSPCPIQEHFTKLTLSLKN